MRSFATIDYFSYNTKLDREWLFADNPPELWKKIRGYILMLIKGLTNRDYNGQATIEEMVSFVDTSIKLNNEFFKNEDRIIINVFA